MKEPFFNWRVGKRNLGGAKPSLFKEVFRKMEKLDNQFNFFLFPSLCVFFLLISYSAISKNKIKPNPSSYEIKTIVIDAGHGGHDAGCSGKHSKEKHITLKVAKQLKGYIQEAFPDVLIILTRETDVFVPLHQRSAIANKNKADLFISIHCNAAPHSSAVQGTETYVMGLHKTESNLSVAKRENAVILEETDYANHYDGFDPNSPMAHITFSLFQNAYHEQSIVFADLVEKQFSQRAGRKSRGVKQAGFLVLYKTAMPSVLIESGFLTNRSEEDFLKSTYGQEIISSAIYRAFKEYKVLVEEKGSVDFIEDSKPELIETQEISTELKVEPKPIKEPEKVVEVSPPIQTESVKPEPIQHNLPVVQPDKKYESSEATQITKEQEKELSFIESYLNKHSKLAEEFDPNEVNQNADANGNFTIEPYDPLFNENALVYKVQIFVSSNDALLNSTDLNNITALEIESLDNGLKRYLSGRFSDYNRVKKHCDELRAAGFTDAFIVKYKGGERVP